MDYQLEQLGPDRFQELVQALLAVELPGVQCFPVGMADGGRDATAATAGESGFAVFQVKYTKRPNAVSDPHKWVLDALAGEARKLKRLIDRGASSYHLITNVAGTGQLDRGSIDKATSILGKEIDIPFMVWWRDDVNRRLDTSMDLKLVYPEIMTGQDALRVLLESSAISAKRRIEHALRAYLRDQYSADSEVRFRQTELQGSLLDLFVDVPAQIKSLSRSSGARRRRLSVPELSLSRVGPGTPDYEAGRLRRAPGAAMLFLSPNVAEHLPWAVLEGAPGQGKSTVAQFLCQVHRMRLLDEKHALKSVDDGYLQTPLRFPIKFEARDFAAWLTDSDSGVEPSESKTLETFVAHEIQRGAGGQDFDVGDLVELATSQPMLMVIDGLDEVANIQARRAVVRQTTAGLERLRENAQSMQVVITTRPAAFSNTPGFSRDQFDYWHLIDLSAEEVGDYADRWAKARRLSDEEAATTREILMSRLEQPHLRELARNPMQLAILLSLIVARGSSLPDQRTALYDAYIDVFLNREAEKSDVVRDHRQTLLNLHQFLGWLLHAQAEEGSDGRITEESLKARIRAFLLAEGHDPKLADELMIGAVDRVVALVSRIEGTYEFEVQPLREYFAARFLYDTAPYSPVGSEVGGTKPERFAGLARSPYWLNVARFFAGCYDRGELPSLADQLEVLAGELPYRQSGHASQLGWLLLSDQVFSQDRHVVARIGQILTDDDLVLQTVTESDLGPSEALPPGNGRDEIYEYAFNRLRSVKHFDLGYRLASFVEENADPERLRDDWFAAFRSLDQPADRSKWVTFGTLAGVFNDGVPDEWMSAWLGEVPSSELPSAILRSGQEAFGDTDEELARGVINLALATGRVAWPRPRSGPATTVVELLGPWLAGPGRILEIGPHGRPVRHGARLSGIESTAAAGFKGDAFRECSDLAEQFMKLVSKSKSGPNVDLVQLRIVAAAHRIWGDRWLVRRLAVCLAEIAAHHEGSPGEVDLCDTQAPIATRMSYAFHRRDNAKWWNDQLLSPLDQKDREFVLASLMSWASGPVLHSLHDVLVGEIESLAQDEFERVEQAVEFSLWRREHNQPLRLADDELLSIDSAKARMLFAHRATKAQRAAAQEMTLGEKGPFDPTVARMVYHRLTTADGLEKRGWSDTVALAQALYDSELSESAVAAMMFWFFDRVPRRMPPEIADRLWNRWDAFPTSLVESAQWAFRWHANSAPVSVARLSTSEDWFRDRYSYAEVAPR